MQGPAGRPGWRILFWAAAIVVLWLALREIPLAEVGEVLGRLKAPQAVFLLAINVGVWVVLAGRWWVILRVRGHRVSVFSLAAYRLAAYSISYLTPGTHVGGEPLQVYLLARRHAVSSADAIASVVLDKSLEVIANFTFLLVGVAVLVGFGILPGSAGPALVGASLLVMALPILYLLLIWRGTRPAAGVLGALAGRWDRLAGLARTTREAEDSVGEFCRSYPAGLVYGALMSAFGWVALIIEYRWMLGFLGLALSLPETVAALTAARLSLLTPLPGGLGALEASQVLALTALGYLPAEGAGLGILIRARDLLFAAAGLAIGGWLANRKGDLKELATTDRHPS